MPFLLRNILILALVPLTLSAYHLAQSNDDEPRVKAHRSRDIGFVLQANPPDPVAALETSRDQFFAQVQQEVDAYLDGLEAERVRQEAIQAALRASQQQAARPSAPVVVSGDCAPVAAIIGWGIVNRESGGNPSARNSSSGAYGCSQTLPSHYAPGGACAGLNMYTVEGQTACTQILYDRGGLAPWAATR